MVKENRLIKRLGNKTNDIKHFKHLLPHNFKKLIEPFAGSFALSLYYYNLDSNITYHINDLDEELFYLYNNLDELIQINNNILSEYNNNLEVNKKNTKCFVKYVKGLEINEIIKNFILKNSFIKGVMFKVVKISNDCKEYRFLKDVDKTNLDYKIILERYKDDEGAFLFLDPPYLFSNNKPYTPQNDENDMTDIIVYVLEYLRVCKCKVMLIINKLKILSWIFKDYIKGEYNLIYQISKKKSTHLIITNY